LIRRLSQFGQQLLTRAEILCTAGSANSHSRSSGAAIAAAIASTGATSMKQMGAVVKAAKEALTGKSVDGKALSDRVRDRLSKL